MSKARSLQFVKYQKQMIIQKIYNHLLLNKIYLTNPGLYYGKTGCLLFFAHYARLFEDDVNGEIVSEITDDIFASVGAETAMGIQQGVCGIGWGVEYILQNRLMEGDSDEILADLDQMILRKEVKTIVSHPDFTGIVRYVAVRLTSPCGGGTDIPFPQDYLTELYQAAANHPASMSDLSIQNDINTIRKTMAAGRFSEKPLVLSCDMLGQVSIDRFPLIPLGLYNGLSGLGIKLLLEDRPVIS